MKKFTVILAALLCAATLQAKITLPPQMADNMVLQQNTKANIWGWANPGETVTVSTTWGDEVYKAKADADGAWKVAVDTPEGSYEDHMVVIAAGKEKIELKHVLIGEVWLASGQSNMEMPLRGFDGCPVEGALQVDSDIVLLEGNYLLLDEDGWRNLSTYADYTISVIADESLLHTRLIDRRIMTGVAREPAVRFVDFSDMPNVRMCLEKTMRADLSLRIDDTGDYHGAVWIRSAAAERSAPRFGGS